jgi:hypothetical protein
MPQAQSIVQRRRARRADERRARATRLRMGGVGLGMVVSLLLALLILLAALEYANLTSNLPNISKSCRPCSTHPMGSCCSPRAFMIAPASIS